MRSALLCVFFALLVHRENVAGDEFRPTPIPLNEWHPYERREDRAGTLQETIQTDSTTAVAVIPAHYWEDALKHSVYLSLVRDKIDQLIAKGDVISPDSKPDILPSKESDDLWEKIKKAPFDRLAEEEPASYGDVTIMAKGRLMEENGGFRFTEDERSKEKCSEEKCMSGVKAFWSVKRVRQRDDEISPGGYHYELTFSVMSQPPKKQRKPYENPIRTFTVRESVPERVVDMPQEHRTYERVLPPTHRPERAIWFHKNISPVSRHHHSRQYNGLDRLFFSLFSDDDVEYNAPQRYRPPLQAPQNPQVAAPVYSQQAKVGYVGQPSDQQKRLTPYPYKLQPYKYARPLPAPPLSPHVQQHYVDVDSFGPVNAYGPHPDHRYVMSGKPIKTTRPAVLPTPLPPLSPPINLTHDEELKLSNSTESSATKAPEIITSPKAQKPRPAPIKINYLTDHVRPPVYNAPPGVFVTMDRKPFKPMPPLKYVHSSKPTKSHRPVDFRPSPQVLDMQQFSEPEHDTAFRPITWNYSNSNATERIEVAESGSMLNNTRKPTITTKGKKPPKKHEALKSTHTTATPEIITAGSNEDENDVQWVNLVGAFTKTTPMKPQKEKDDEPDTTTTSTTTTTTTVATTPKRKRTTTTEVPQETTTTTRKPTKRTRPPPKFTKNSEKTKKHKRITTTTKAPEAKTKAPEVKATQDLTPQASSAALKPSWNTTKAVSTTSSTTTSTTTTTTTAKPSTTTTKAVKSTTSTIASTNTEVKSTVATTQPKAKNRYRQSTLIHKGTSVKHDKWSATTPAPVEKSRPVSASNKYPPRRKGSNFVGYYASSTERTKEDKHAVATTAKATTEAYKATSTSSHAYEDTVDQYENTGESSDYSSNRDEDEEEEEEEENDEQETKDQTEYIFQSTSIEPSENEIADNEETITEQIVTSQFSTPKNKTKCKKKKFNTTTEESPRVSYEQSTSTSTTTTESSSPSSFLDEIFGGYTAVASEQSSSKSEPEKQESEHHAKFVKLDDDLQDFLDSLNKGEEHSDDAPGEYDEDNEEPSIDDEEDLPLDNDEEIASPRDNEDDYSERPFSLLELIAME